jgi:hypothetical protein
VTSYRTLGPRRSVGKADTSGNNTGKWTIAFTPDVLAAYVSQFEVYKIIVTGAAGSTFNIYIDGFQWDTSVFGQQNSWDPVQPMPVQPGQTVYFYYSDAVTDNTPPTAVLWLRYDADQYALGAAALWAGKCSKPS